MAENRIPRDAQTRDVEAREFSRRASKQWTPPDVLPEPDKVPGYEYRWVRVSSRAESDPRNFSMRLREGWEPVKLEEQPKFALLADPNSRFAGNIEIGGLLLCKMPLEMVAQRRAYYQQRGVEQMRSVDNNLMRQSDPRMPIFNERKTTVTFGTGK